jgi:hypothetical protein
LGYSVCLFTRIADFRLVDVERPRCSTTYVAQDGLTIRRSEPLPAWPFLAEVGASDANSSDKDPMNPSERIDQLIAKLTDSRGWQNVREHSQDHP